MQRLTLLRLPAVRQKTGLCRTMLYQLMAEGTFPRPVSIGHRTVAWVESEVDAWISEQMNRRDAPH